MQQERALSGARFFARRSRLAPQWTHELVAFPDARFVDRRLRPRTTNALGDGGVLAADSRRRAAFARAHGGRAASCRWADARQSHGRGVRTGALLRAGAGCAQSRTSRE